MKRCSKCQQIKKLHEFYTSKYTKDGFNIKSAKQMKELIDDLKTMADDALNHKKLYLDIKRNKK